MCNLSGVLITTRYASLQDRHLNTEWSFKGTVQVIRGHHTNTLNGIMAGLAPVLIHQ